MARRDHIFVTPPRTSRIKELSTINQSHYGGQNWYWRTYTMENGDEVSMGVTNPNDHQQDKVGMVIHYQIKESYNAPTSLDPNPKTHRTFAYKHTDLPNFIKAYQGRTASITKFIEIAANIAGSSQLELGLMDNKKFVEDASTVFAWMMKKYESANWDNKTKEYEQPKEEIKPIEAKINNDGVTDNPNKKTEAQVGPIKSPFKVYAPPPATPVEETDRKWDNFQGVESQKSDFPGTEDEIAEVGEKLDSAIEKAAEEEEDIDLDELAKVVAEAAAEQKEETKSEAIDDLKGKLEQLTETAKEEIQAEEIEVEEISADKKEIQAKPEETIQDIESEPAVSINDDQEEEIDTTKEPEKPRQDRHGLVDDSYKDMPIKDIIGNNKSRLEDIMASAGIKNLPAKGSKVDKPKGEPPEKKIAAVEPKEVKAANKEEDDFFS